MLHVNGKTFYQICALSELNFSCPGILVGFILFLLNKYFSFFPFSFERRALRLCDSAIWTERTSDFMLGCYYYYNY